MSRLLEPLRGGYDVDENAIRFSNYFHVLRELVHLSCGWLPLEPRLEVKYALGDHLHDDARAVTKIKRRLYELRTPSDYPGAPAEELAALLDRANAATTSAEYIEMDEIWSFVYCKRRTLNATRRESKLATHGPGWPSTRRAS